MLDILCFDHLNIEQYSDSVTQHQVKLWVQTFLFICTVYISASDLPQTQYTKKRLVVLTEIKL